MAIVRTSDLGWTTNQNVTSLFNAQVSSMVAGDVLVLDDRYQYTGDRFSGWPNGITIAGGAVDAGLDFTNCSANGEDIFRISSKNNVTFLDLKLVCVDVPDTGYGGLNPVAGVDFLVKRMFRVSNSSFITFDNCHFEGYINTMIFMSSCNNVTIEDCQFYRVREGVGQVGSTSNITYRNSLFHYLLGDGIKTAPQGLSQSILIDSCVFLECARDGVDSTGGFYQSTIQDCIFVQQFTALDIKELYEDGSPESGTGDFDFGGPKNSEITVLRCEAINVRNFTVVTFEDRVPGGFVTPTLAETWVPRNITMTDCILESFVEDMGGHLPNVYLIKDCWKCYATNTLSYGDTNTGQTQFVNAYNTGMPKEISVTGTTFLPRRTQSRRPDSYYQALAGNDPNSITYGPSTGPASPILLTYTPGGTNPIQDANGNTAAGFTDQPVTNNVV